MDCYVVLKYGEGHELELMKEPTQVVPEKKLYFINFGAYRTHEFTEHHQNAFYVAASLPEALKRAKDELCLGMEMIHKDDGFLIDRVSQLTEFDVDDVLEIEEVDDFYVSLKPTASANRPLPHSAYIKLEVVWPVSFNYQASGLIN